MRIAPLRTLHRHTSVSIRGAAATTRTRTLATSATLDAAFSVPAAADVPASWAALTPVQRASVTQSLDTKMLGDWKTLTLDEKKAAYYVAFGPHGPRTPTRVSTSSVLLGIAGVLTVSCALSYALKKGGQETPHTMTREWQEKTEEMLKAQKANPVTGVSSEGYTGPGMVQSK